MEECNLPREISRYSDKWERTDVMVIEPPLVLEESQLSTPGWITTIDSQTRTHVIGNGGIDLVAKYFAQSVAM